MRSLRLEGMLPLKKEEMLPVPCVCVYVCVTEKSGKTVDRAVPGQSGKVSNTITPQPQPILTLRGHVYEKVAINAGFTIHHLQEVQGL